MDRGYWSGVMRRRIARRQVLASAAVAGAAGAFLAACGGGDSDDEDPESTASRRDELVTTPVETTAQAVRGGVLKDRNFGDPPSLDVVQAIVSWNPFGYGVYSTLVQREPGYLQPIGETFVPDLAESWEHSPDGLEIALRIRPGVKFHNKPPVNGRDLDIDDVVFSYERFAEKGSARSSIVNSVDPGAPVLSLTATDSQTVVIKLAEPLVYALALFGPPTGGTPIIIPKETDDTLDLRQDMLGTGPFMLTRYENGVGFTFERHPDYWDPDWALVDKVEMPIVPEYASALAQLKAGNIYRMAHTASDIRSEDALPLKSEVPDIALYQSDLNTAGVIGNILAFGWLPEGESPFLDERVRQAISMSLDRDAYLNAFHNVDKFRAEGIPVDARWNSHLPANQAPDGWWLDPQGDDFGENAKHFQFNLEEGKALLAAAGYPNGFTAKSNYVTTPELGQHPRSAEVVDGMIRELGIDVQVNEINYSREYQPLYRDGRGQFEGWGYVAAVGGHGNSAIGLLAIENWSKGVAPTRDSACPAETTSRATRSSTQ